MMVCSQCLAGHRLVQVEHILFVVRRHLLRKEIWREVKLIRCLLRPELHVSGCPRWMSIIVMKHHDRKQSYLVREGFIGLHISVTVRHQKSQGSSFSVLSASSNNTHIVFPFKIVPVGVFWYQTISTYYFCCRSFKCFLSDIDFHK